MSKTSSIQHVFIMAGAVPNTSLALVTELFRDWKSPLADGARDVIKWYTPEAQKLARPQRFP